MRIYLGVASHCNMSCEYCFKQFLKGRETPTPTLLDLSLVSQLLKLLEDVHSDVQLILHGNEPLVAHVPYLRQLFSVVRRSRISLSINIQSNLTLLTEEVVRLLKDNGITVGASLDGPKMIHDATRKYLNGRGSFDDVMRGVTLLKNQAVNVYVVCVYTKRSVGHETEIYNFFKEYALSFQFGPVTMPNDPRSQTLALQPNECAHFYNTMFDLYFFDRSRSVKVINVDTLIGRLLYSSKIELPPLCCQDGLYLDFDGFLYRCGRFAGDHRFSIGHVQQFDSYESLMKSPGSLNYEDRIRQFSNRCHDCDLGGFCTRGCYHDALISDSLPLGSPYCEFFKSVVNHAVDRIYESTKGNEKKAISNQAYSLIRPR